MAKILVKGRVATVEIEQDYDGEIVATCVKHSLPKGVDPAAIHPDHWPCRWTWSESNNWNDVMQTPDVERHADEGN